MHRRLTLFCALVFFLGGAFSYAAGLPAKASAANGVTVKVTPVTISGPTWDFEVALDTHSKDLSDDLLKSAVLVTDTRVTHTPTEWRGDAPGGHHRKGVLRFKPVTPQPRTIELQIRRPGEAAPRTFSWVLQ
jgi:hypothetical protein